MGPLDHVTLVGRELDALAIPWALGGSMAGSLLGEPRSTNDIDLAVRLDPPGVPALVEAVQDDYYAPLDALRAAAATHDSFNLIHLTSSFKVDLFFLGDSRLDRLQIERRLQVQIADSSAPIWVTSAPDLILRKLSWFQLGGEVSDRQWNDVQSLLRVQHDRIDLDHLRADAAAVDLTDLLERAIHQAQ